MMKGEVNDNWTFLTNHMHVILCLWMEPDMRIRDVADKVGITERAAQNIIYDLEQAKVLEKRKEGRRNHYTIDPKTHLRHQLERHCELGKLLGLFTGKKS